MQGTDSKRSDYTDWTRELWFGLLFVCIGWTVWPLMIYFLGRTVGLDYFLCLSLREWAEIKVYGPLCDGGLRTLSRIGFLFSPWMFFLSLRLLLAVSKRGG